MSFVVSIVTGIASAIGTVAGWIWQGISTLSNSAWELLTKYVIPTLKWLVNTVWDLYSKINEAIKTVRSWIDKAFGEALKAIDLLEAELRKLIGDQVDRILTELGFREGKLKEWVKEWVLDQFRSVWDTIAKVRGEFFQLAINIRKDIWRALSELEAKLTLKVQILGHRLDITGKNVDKVLEDLGLKEPEKVTPETELIQNKLDKQRDLSWKAQLIAYEESEKELPLPSEDINEVIEKIRKDWKDEPCMEGIFLRWQIELIRKDLEMDNEADKAKEVIQSIIEAKETV